MSHGDGERATRSRSRSRSRSRGGSRRASTSTSESPAITPSRMAAQTQADHRRIPSHMRVMTEEILTFLTEETVRAKLMERPQSEILITEEDKHLEQLQVLESLCDVEAMCVDLQSRGAIPILLDAALEMQHLEMARQCLLILTHMTGFVSLARQVCKVEYLGSMIQLMKSRDSFVLQAALSLIERVLEMNSECMPPAGWDEFGASSMEMGDGGGDVGAPPDNPWLAVMRDPDPVYHFADDVANELVLIMHHSRDLDILKNVLKVMYHIVDWRFGVILETKWTHRFDLLESVCLSVRKLQYQCDFDTDELEHGWGIIACYANSSAECTTHTNPLTPSQHFVTQLTGLITRFCEQNLKDGHIFHSAASHVFNVIQRIVRHDFFAVAIQQYPELARTMVAYLAKVEPDRRPLGADVTDIYNPAFGVLDVVAQNKIIAAADWVLRSVPLLGVAKTHMAGIHWRTLEGHLNAIAGLNPEKYGRIKTSPF